MSSPTPTDMPEEGKDEGVRKAVPGEDANVSGEDANVPGEDAKVSLAEKAQKALATAQKAIYYTIYFIIVIPLLIASLPFILCNLCLYGSIYSPDAEYEERDPGFRTPGPYI